MHTHTYKHIYCEEIFTCLKAHLNYQRLTDIYDMKYFVNSPIFCKIDVDRIVVEPG